MDKRAFEAWCWRLYRGEATFGEFERATREHWQALARYILRRWRISAWAGIEDVTQDLLTGCWARIWQYAPEVGTPMASYVVYNAVDVAKKQVHRYRGASRSGNADGNPSRMQFSYVDVFGEEDADRRAEESTQVPGGHEERVEVGEAIARAHRHCRGERERRVVDAVVRHDCLERAARELLDDPEAARVCRIGTARQAARLVVRVADEVTRRLEAEETAA